MRELIKTGLLMAGACVSGLAIIQQLGGLDGATFPGWFHFADDTPPIVVIRRSVKAVLPAAQQSILTAKDVEEWMAAHCMKSPDGVIEFTLYDPEKTDTSKMPDYFKPAFAAPIDKLPDLVIQQGGKPEVFPLPADVSAMIRLLNEHGGQ